MKSDVYLFQNNMDLNDLDPENAKFSYEDMDNIVRVINFVTLR